MSDSALNTTNSTYPWSTDHCDPILLQLATNDSIYQTIPLGLCPDFITTNVFSAVLLGTQLVLAVGTIIFVCIRRNHEPVKSRGAFMITLSNILLSIVSILFLLRFIIGRAIYPCSLYTLLFFTVFSFVIIPYVMRLYRLFIVMKTNELKLKYSHMERESLGLAAVTSIEQLQQEIQKMDVKEAQQQQQTQIVGNSFNPEQSSSRDQATVVVTSPEIGAPSASYFSHEKHEQLKRKISILKFLVTPPVLILPIAIGLGLCVLFWFFISSLELLIPKPIIVDRSFAMNLTVGCSMSLTGVVFVGIIGLVHVALLFFVCIVNCRTKDTLFIKYEIVIMLVIYTVPVVAYLILGLIPFVYELTDYFIPYGTVFIAVPIMEALFSGCIPACISLKPKVSDRLKNKSRQSVETKLDGVRLALQHHKLRVDFVNFAQRSFCPEFVLCWQEISKYQKAKTIRKRMEIYEHIVKTFLENGSPLELNLPQETRMEYVEYFKAEMLRNPTDKKNGTEVEFFVPTKLDELKGKCEFNLIDIYQRFKEVPFVKKMLQSHKYKPAV